MDEISAITERGPWPTSNDGKASSMKNSPLGMGLGIIDPNGRLKNLADYGKTMEIDFTIPPKRYYTSGLEMVRMAHVYLEEGSLENAFVLYMKFMTLFQVKMRDHPGFAKVSVTDRAINAQKMREVLPKADKLKVRLLKQYRDEYTRYVAEQKHRMRLEAERLSKQRADERRRAELFPPVVLRRLTMAAAAAGSRKLSVQLAPTASADHEHPSAGVVPAHPGARPSVLVRGNRLSGPAKRPSGPAKRPSVPARPSVLCPATRHSVFGEATRPSVDRDAKPDSFLSTSLHGKAGKLGLRDMVVPTVLTKEFLQRAKRNSDVDIETCGVLAGKLSKDQLIITHLLIPKQRGTPDSCLTLLEHEIFEYLDEHDLITLGWIHTHPTQEPYLSSVDLHTHLSYQLQVPEALAVVCAPQCQLTEYYILSPTHGLGLVARCPLAGWHPHPTRPPIYMKAEHAKMDFNAELDVVDFRQEGSVDKSAVDKLAVDKSAVGSRQVGSRLND